MCKKFISLTCRKHTQDEVSYYLSLYDELIDRAKVIINETEKKFITSQKKDSSLKQYSSAADYYNKTKSKIHPIFFFVKLCAQMLQSEAIIDKIIQGTDTDIQLDLLRYNVELLEPFKSYTPMFIFTNVNNKNAIINHMFDSNITYIGNLGSDYKELDKSDYYLINPLGILIVNDNGNHRGFCHNLFNSQHIPINGVIDLSEIIISDKKNNDGIKIERGENSIDILIRENNKTNRLNLFNDVFYNPFIKTKSFTNTTYNSLAKMANYPDKLFSAIFISLADIIIKNNITLKENSTPLAEN